jgi:hypothetical protein
MSVLVRRLNLPPVSGQFQRSSVASSAFGCACSSSPPCESFSTIHGLPALQRRTVLLVLKAQSLFLATVTGKRNAVRTKSSSFMMTVLVVGASSMALCSAGALVSSSSEQLYRGAHPRSGASRP